MYLNKIIVKHDGSSFIYEFNEVHTLLYSTMEAAKVVLPLESIVKEIFKNAPAECSQQELFDVLILSVCQFIELDPLYDRLAAQLSLEKMYKSVLGLHSWHAHFEKAYKDHFVSYIRLLVADGTLDSRCLNVDIERISECIDVQRDKKFKYLGLQTLTPRYLLSKNASQIELPQHFWLRVAIGLSLLEKNSTDRVLDLYDLLSTFKCTPGTPTLLRAGLARPQLSSCYLTYVGDDLQTIFKCLSDNAQLSKWSGGVANDWSGLRATGALIKSIGIESQGVIPFLKIANDVTCAINRSGKRRGATVAYMEPWHADFEDFCDLRKNTGDERRRAHDMNFAAWVPDLFMKRVRDNQHWSFFSPDETPDLHELYGKSFEEKFEHYEAMGASGQLKIYKRVQAQDLWKRMLTRLFETGYPWITFKDACNIRSPQDHCGVVHSSNLCTEITLNTSLEETAVCNLASINLAQFVTQDGFNRDSFAKSIKLAIRMLDNVIDINFYPTKEAQHANIKHRPIGLGLMGFQDALFELNIPYNSEKALQFADEITELYSYHAILASSLLAAERGTYLSYKGSKWDRGILPLDTIALLEQERQESINVNRIERLDWSEVRSAIKQFGMRNSNTMAIAPTATISNIVGCYPCIEPQYSNLYVKSNMSGEFTVINHYLVNDLKQSGFWSPSFIAVLKSTDGNLEGIDSLPEQIRSMYKTAFELDPEWMIDITAVRAKWLDQSISHNIFMRGVSGKKMSDIYFSAWKRGLKTTYYLRTKAASSIEKATVPLTKQGIEQALSVCSLENNDCESCQ